MQPERPSERWLAGITVVLAAVFVLVGIGTPLLGQTVFAGSDLFMGKAPWNELVPTGFQAQNPYVGDTVDATLPQAHAFAERLRDGDFASWWALNTGGGQLGSVPGVLSPLSVPYLVLPVELAPGFVKLLELGVTVGGMVLFARRLGLGRAAGLVGGVAYASTGFMVAWTNWPHTKVAAFVPLLFWAVERLVQRRRVTDLVPVALVVAAMLLGGFPAVTAYALMVAAVYLLVRLVVAEGWRPRRIAWPAVLAAVGVGAGVAVTSFQLVAFVRELSTSAISGREQSDASHSPVVSMITMFAPWALGGTNPTSSAQMWFGVGHPVEELSYVGAAVLVLAVVGTLCRRRAGLPPGVRELFVVAAVGTVVVVFVGGPLLAALQQLPVFDTNRIGRARSVLGFFLAVLAAIGFDALVRAPDAPWRAAWRRWAWWATAVAGTAGVAVVAFFVLRTARRLASERGQLAYLDGELRTAALVAAVTVVAALAGRLSRGGLKVVALAVVPAAVVAQALTVVLPYWPRVAPEHFYPTTSTHEFLADELGSDRLVSVVAMQTGTESYYGLNAVGGRTFVARAYDELVRAWCAQCFITPTYMFVPPDLELLDDPVLDRLGARYLVMDPGLPVPGASEVVGDGRERLALESGRTVTVDVPTGRLRAVSINLADDFTTADPWASIEVVVRDADGDELARNERRLFTGVRTGPFTVALPETQTAGAAEVEITLDADETMQLTADDGDPALVLARPTDDGLRLVHSEGTVVYERLTALPRIRWAATSVVETDRARALELAVASTEPGVVLSEPGPDAAGEAEIEVLEDSGDLIEVAVDAEGLGYVVVADGLQGRWVAEVDGEHVPLRIADHGYVAVEVPAGEHRVRLAYDEPASGLAYVASGATALGLVLVGALGGLLGRRRRRGSAQPAGTADDVG